MPGKCAWMGASPETFLKYDRNGFFTMALAGTQPVATAKNPPECETRTSRNNKS
ncbi:MAG: chorismate-binding protein [Butyricimonas virosa]